MLSMQRDRLPSPLGEFRFLTDPALLIMVSIAHEAKHGYAIMKDIERFSGLEMSAGTLYGAIARLDVRGWIEEVQTTNYRRRPFRLTREGVHALRDHLEFLDNISALGLQRIQATRGKRKGAIAK